MKTYLLEVKTYDYSDETDDEYIEIFNTFERAKSYGLEFLIHELESYCKDINKSIKQALKESKIDYDFRITEEDIEYAENFKKKLEFEEEIEELLIYEPTHKEFILDYTGEITNICIRYLFNQKETKWRNCVYLKPNDLLPNAGTKFKIGDLVKIVKPNKRMEDCSYNEHPEYSDVYVVRYLPRRIEGQKYLRNTYALSEISDDNYAPGIYTSDMMGNGYYLNDDTPQIVLDHVFDYDSFEFFDGELEGTNRILKLISSFLKGKIDNLELFIKAYESFKSNYEGKMPNIFTDEYLKLAGFSNWNISQIKGEHEKIYNMSDKERMDYIRYHTNGLKGIPEKNIKQIETDFYDNVFVLTLDGILYENGELIDGNIEQLYMFDGLHLYKVTDDNRIRPIEENKKWDDIDIYLNNKDCSYKKILMSTMNIVALTKEGNIRASHQYPICVIPENYIGVQDIKIEEIDGLDTPYVYKNNRYIKLYYN